VTDDALPLRSTQAHGGLALFTDLYELTMMQAWLAEGLTDTAVCSLFVRRLPEQRNFLLACGIDAVLDHLERLAFSDDDVDYLRGLGSFTEDFLTWLRGFRFTGDVYAVAEGTPVFANEPILEIVAPIASAQFVETVVMNQIHVQTVLASKAVRIVTAAGGRTVIDFGARRAHGIDAALKGARAYYIAGVNATANVLAGKQYGIPVAGTMAHSYVQTHDDEREAFRAFARTFPGTVLLVDTYDTLRGVDRAIEVIRSAPDGLGVSAVRLDSGDIDSLSRETRRRLDAAGLQRVRIFVSSDLDEHVIARLLAAGAPVDGFGVGTGMAVAADAPSLDLVYKLAEYAGRGRTKLSREKSVLPGRKQVFRRAEHGRFVGDVIGLAGERLEGDPLLRLVMRGGTREHAPTDLKVIRKAAAERLASLPAPVTALEAADPPYPVSISDALQAEYERVREAVK
jgi:nicotinate phosphoribosyltransferase